MADLDVLSTYFDKVQSLQIFFIYFELDVSTFAFTSFLLTNDENKVECTLCYITLAPLILKMRKLGTNILKKV